MLKNNSRDVSLERPNQGKQDKFARKGASNHAYLNMDNLHQMGQPEERPKEVPVHIRLFGQNKDSPQKQEENQNVYKSNNRDWQRGLRQSSNPKQAQDGATAANNPASKGEFARKLWQELKTTNDGGHTNDDYQQ